MAGRVIEGLRGAGFDNAQAATVVEALFLSRSRRHLRVAWGVLLVALAGSASDEAAERALAEGIVYAEDFERLMPLIGEDKSRAELERIFEQADLDRSGIH